MANDFEPDVVETVPVDTVLEKLPISSENREWLKGLFCKEATIDQPDYFLLDFQTFTKQIDELELDPSAFKPLFLFDFGELYHLYKMKRYISIISLYSYCFDESKLSIERIKVLPDLFTKKEEGKPSIFKPYVARILYYIKYCDRKDKSFSEAYQKKLQEIRAGSFLDERAVYYLQLVFQKLPERTNEANEEPLTPEEMGFFLDYSEEYFFKTAPYSVQLVTELEGIPAYISYFDLEKMKQRFHIYAFPFILYGEEVYLRIFKTFDLLFPKSFYYKCSADDITQLDIPRWNEKNYIHEVFFWLALTLKVVSKDISISILNRIFEGLNISDIIRIFSVYIKDKYSSIYGAFLKEKNFEHTNPVRNKLEYLDWALTTDNRNPHKFDLNKCRLFLDYLEYLSLSKPENKQTLVPFIRNKSIKDVLDFAARKRDFGEFTFCEQKYITDEWYENFVDIIDEESAAISTKLSLSIEDYKKNILSVENEKDKLAFFKQLCKTLGRKSPEDALSVAKLWFSEFHNRLISHLSREAILNFAENERFFCTTVFRCFINDEDFVCHFLSIPQEASQGGRLRQAGQFWFISSLAFWIGHNNSQTTNIFDAASQELENKRVIFSDKMSRFILSNQIFEKFFTEGTYSSHSLNLNDLNKDAKFFLCNLLAVFGGIPQGSILKNPHEAEEHFPLYLIEYRYSHDEFIPLEFLDFLFYIENPGYTNSEFVIYTLEIIREACKKNVLTKQIVVERVTKYIREHRNILIESDQIKSLISYFFVETKENCIDKAQTALFLQFCESAIQESENSYIELSMFLKLRSYFRNEVDSMLVKHTENLNTLIIRCSKLLNVFKKFVEQNNFPVEENIFYYDYILPATDFIWERTENIWKALKPLLLAFRASKKRMLRESLSGDSLLFEMIASFFDIEDKEKLIELRYNMANDFADYLKPTKKERQEENYTELERKEQEKGFDLSYIEPSPFWRYAYIRALGDLGIKTDKRGHFFNELLKTASNKDPSEKVRVAARKVTRELRAIRRGFSGNNHKKCLFEAFWWLRQAHMLSLGAEVDKKKANDLRIKEWR
jgi:hypothetical protein